MKRRRETSGGVRVGKESLGTKRICTLGGRRTDDVRKSRVWLKTVTPGRNRCTPEIRQLSPVDLFESLESGDILSVAAEKRCAYAEKQLLDEADDEEETPTRPKRSSQPRRISPTLIGVKQGGLTVDSARSERFLFQRASSKLANTWDDDETPESPDEGTPHQATLIGVTVIDSAPSNLPAVENANSTSSKKVLETQAALHIDSPLCSFVEESVLSLPQCPTIDSDSSDIQGGSSFIDGQRRMGEAFEGHDSDPISEVCR